MMVMSSVWPSRCVMIITIIKVVIIIIIVVVVDLIDKHCFMVA